MDTYSHAKDNISLSVFTDGVKLKTIGYLIRKNDRGEREILLGHHKKQGKLNGFGGKVGDKPEHKDETIEEALAREAKEELGVRIISPQKRAEILFIFCDETGSEQQVLCHIYFISAWDGEIRASEELRNPTWFRESEMPWSDMWPNDRLWLEPLLKRTEFLTAEYRFDPKNGLIASESVIEWKEV